MRRSFAPSSIRSITNDKENVSNNTTRLSLSAPMKHVSSITSLLKQNDIMTNQQDDTNEDKENNGITIIRQPLFEFLEIPQNLKKPFKIPSGCIITEK